MTKTTISVQICDKDNNQLDHIIRDFPLDLSGSKVSVGIAETIAAGLCFQSQWVSLNYDHKHTFKLHLNIYYYHLEMICIENKKNTTEYNFKLIID